MNKAAQLAAKLDGNAYGKEISSELAKQAELDGLVVVFGQSDDLMELCGAICDEADAFEGTRVLITPSGLLKPPADGGECEERCPFFAAAAKNAVTLEALWNDDHADGSPAWSYRTAIPHKTFRIFEDDGLYCVGIVFALSDVGGGLHEEQ